MNAHHSVLLIVAPGRRGDSLCAMLQNGDWVAVIRRTNNGKAGLESIRRDCPGAVIVDGDLPHEDAWSTLDEIQRTWPGTWCVVWAHTASQARRARAAGADGILEADCSPTHLLEALKWGNR